MNLTPSPARKSFAINPSTSYQIEQEAEACERPPPEEPTGSDGAAVKKLGSLLAIGQSARHVRGGGGGGERRREEVGNGN